jgi:hypothetical protein
MITYKQRNITIGMLAAMSILLIEFTFELMYELMVEACKVLYEFGIILFECFEFGIEAIIKNSFHLNHQQAQLVTFYILIGLAVLACLYLWFKLPVLYNRLKRNLKARWLISKRRTAYSWRSMTLISKIKWVTTTALGATGMLFLI